MKATNKEAINLIDIIRMGYICDPQECGLDKIKGLCDVFKCDDYHNACVMAIEALEKQEPKKVKDYHHCPNCGYGLPAKGITDKWCECCYEWKYCPECGQALKWR